MKKSKYNEGFTFLELLVVISIIGVLSAMFVVLNTSARVKARDSRKIQTAKAMQLALNLYYQDHQAFPEIPCSGGSLCYLPDNEANWANLGTALSPYMPLSPPTTDQLPGFYYYGSSQPFKTYMDGNCGVWRSGGFHILVPLEDQTLPINDNDSGVVSYYYEVAGGDYSVYKNISFPSCASL
jgi:prepilin-type N-terminal cleavage/methylation domain-containing protein